MKSSPELLYFKQFRLFQRCGAPIACLEYFDAMRRNNHEWWCFFPVQYDTNGTIGMPFTQGDVHIPGAVIYLTCEIDVHAHKSTTKRRIMMRINASRNGN